ncbi:hypothetical protein EWM64_g598 [Hericium alpestre]|uniref:G domain-containing protein n=1 Tax=Hericium alpestre TaxID=135208 RepID=A0A4Z0AAN7_9AGAM|nr:hypothetical protein EWM64_g598 [Hericium alpestre]
MGATGSGKTTFINLVSGSDMRIGRGLTSCTSDVQLAPPFEFDGHRITLIDTPGFDDTNKSDTDILKLIALFLSTSYEQGMKLTGVIYMHRISDVRMGGVSRRNFSMFRQLCGDSTLKNVVIVTNMWGQVEREVGEEREAELRDNEIFFRPVLEKGAQLLRHENTRESGQTIMQYLLENRPEALRIQRELVDQHLDISETAAGETLSRELMEQARKHRQELKLLQEEMQAAIKAKDEETRKELEQESQRLQREMSRLQNESTRLATEYKEEKARMEIAMKEMQAQAARDAEAAMAEHTHQMKALQDQLQRTANDAYAERQALQNQMNRLQQQYDEARASSDQGGGIFTRIGKIVDGLFGL